MPRNHRFAVSGGGARLPMPAGCPSTGPSNRVREKPTSFLHVCSHQNRAFEFILDPWAHATLRKPSHPNPVRLIRTILPVMRSSDMNHANSP